MQWPYWWALELMHRRRPSAPSKWRGSAVCKSQYGCRPRMPPVALRKWVTRCSIVAPHLMWEGLPLRPSICDMKTRGTMMPSRLVIRLLGSVLFAAVLSACGGGTGGALPSSPIGPDRGPGGGQSSPPISPPTPQPYGDVFHVRPDGGSALQCNGRFDAPYAGQGVGQNCAWQSPMVALPARARSSDPELPPRIRGGDTLLIHPGQYMVGAGAPGAELCSGAHAYDCGEMRSVPSGPDPSRPTRIVGYGHDQGCKAPPLLWGTERTASVLNLVGSNNVEVSCLELTDKEPCIEMQQLQVDGQLLRGPAACRREESSFPWGRWASNGIKAYDSSNVVLKDLNIHGLAHAGIYAVRLKDWTLTRGLPPVSRTHPMT